MYVGEIAFTSLPDIGFAMRHSRMYYSANYGNSSKKCIEIAYINSGGINLTFQGNKMHAPEGSIVVLFRHLPISTETAGEGMHSHDTVLGEFEYLDFSLGDNDDVLQDLCKMKIPFITMPSARTEKIGSVLRRIVSDLTEYREEKSFYASVSFVSILKELSDMYIAGKPAQTTDKNVTKIIKYIEENIDRAITVAEIASYIGRSPNHTGYIFRKHMGMRITEYINLCKMKKVAMLIKMQNISFGEACGLVSLCDESYGYRLFKKHIGLTPGEFIRTNIIIK